MPTSHQQGQDSTPPQSHGLMGAMRRIAGPVLVLLVVAFVAWYIIGRARAP
jgi:hypothetical protein